MNPHLDSQLSKLEIEFEVMEKMYKALHITHVHVFKKTTFEAKTTKL